MALTYSWNTITVGQCDAQSPINEPLMEAMRQNFIHLKEWLGKSYTPAENHDHDDVNSKSVVLGTGVVTETKLGASAVAVAKLKMSQGTFTASTGGTFYVPIARYSHHPSLTKAGSIYAVQLLLQTRQYLSSVGEVWEVTVSAQTDNSESFTVKWDYHAA